MMWLKASTRPKQQYCKSKRESRTAATELDQAGGNSQSRPPWEAIHFPRLYEAEEPKQKLDSTVNYAKKV